MARLVFAAYITLGTRCAFQRSTAASTAPFLLLRAESLRQTTAKPKKGSRRKNAPAVPHAAADRRDQELHAADADAPSEKTVAHVEPHAVVQDPFAVGTNEVSREDEHKTDVDDGARVAALGRELYQVDPLRALLRAGPGEEY